MTPADAQIRLVMNLAVVPSATSGPRSLNAWPARLGMVQAEVTAPGRQDRCWVAILDQ